MQVRTALLVAATLALTAACDSKPGSQSAPAESSVRITRISPDPASPLKVGEQVTLAVDVDYQLAAGSGTVTLVIQGGDGQRAGPQHVEVVTKGSGKVALRSEFKVPETTALIIYTPLNLQGQGSTSIVESRAYKVLPAGGS